MLTRPKPRPRPRPNHRGRGRKVYRYRYARVNDSCNYVTYFGYVIKNHANRTASKLNNSRHIWHIGHAADINKSNAEEVTQNMFRKYETARTQL